jgi:hypothetical protein
LELNQIETGEFVVGTSLVGGTDVIGDGLSSVSTSAVRCSIRRGRWGQLYDDFEAATISVTLNNEDREFDPSYASGTYYGELLPGRRMKVQVGAYPLVSGFVNDYDLEYDVSGRSVTVLKGTDALGRLGALEFDAWTNGYTYATAKLSAICDRSEVAWPDPLQDFIGFSRAPVGGGPVSVTLVSDSVSWGSNVLSYMQLIARSDYLSWLFAAADGKLTLRPTVQWSATDGSNWTPGAAVASFGGANIPYQSITAQYGSETLYSHVSADTPAIDAQTAVVADLNAWTLDYGPPRRLTVTDLLIGGDVNGSAEDLTLGLAESLLAFYEAPAFRITEISVELAGLSTANQNIMLGIDIAEAVAISFTPNGITPAISQTVAVQGIAHDITPDSHVVTLSVIDYTA